MARQRRDRDVSLLNRPLSFAVGHSDAQGKNQDLTESQSF